MRLTKLLVIFIGVLFISVLSLVACTKREPLETVNYVDIEKFMGDWYVIANIPTMFEKNAVKVFFGGNYEKIASKNRFLRTCSNFFVNVVRVSGPH